MSTLRFRLLLWTGFLLSALMSVSPAEYWLRVALVLLLCITWRVIAGRKR